MKRFAKLLSVMLVAVLLLTVVGTALASTEPITLRMIESLTSEPRTKLLREIADNYEKENPNVKIEIITPPFEGADAKISQMLATKQPLDIVEVREQMITMFSNNGWIMPLDEQVNAWEGKKTMTAAALESMTLIGGKAWMVPSGFYQRCLFYRKDLFDAAGLQPPKTYEEMLEVGKKLTKPEENKYGYAFRGGNGGNQYYEVEALSWLGFDKLANTAAAFYLKDGEGKTIFTTPEAKEALEYHKKLYLEASPSDSVTWAFSEMVQGFINGTAAMLIQDSEVIATCEAELQEGQWWTAPLPVGPSGQSVSPNGYSGWGVTSYTEHPEEAVDFLLYFLNSENNTKYAKVTALVPIHTSAVEDPFFKEGPFAAYMEMANNPDVYTYAVRPQMYEAFASYKEEIDQEFQKYLKDQISADDLLAHLDKIWSEAYAQEGQLWQ